MPIIIRLDRVLADKKMKLNDLTDKVGISNVNLSNLKTGKVKAIRFSTLEAICEILNCQPGDILEFVPKDSDSFEDDLRGANPPFNRFFEQAYLRGLLDS
ncbi:helix-turn-helix transcriptional regulator [Paenibacillus faecalis]|uniref:helix-turn-helix domain-containing protein n=1 Tax=Paenibacillus faecalis TaxID=2079532 RepID=UPI003076B5F9